MVGCGDCKHLAGGEGMRGGATGDCSLIVKNGR